MRSRRVNYQKLLTNYNKPGTYLIILELAHNRNFTIGKIGQHPLEKGYYLYIGRSLGPGGLAARIKHHLSKTDNPHWHIDHIKTTMKVSELWLEKNSKRKEHIWANQLRKLTEFSEPVKSFGSSDCNCYSHLFYCRRRPTVTLRNKLSPTVKLLEI